MGDLTELIRNRDLEALRAAILADPAAARHAKAVGAAAGVGWQPGLELLVKAGADLNALWRNYRPLHALLQEDAHKAVAEPSPERLACLAWMLEHGADPEQTGAWPRARCIIVAAMVGVPSYVEVLVKGGARMDGFAAAALCDVAAVKKAIRADPAFPQARDDGGLTALQCAAGSRMPGANTLAVARLLIEAGADIHAQTKSWAHQLDAVYFAATRKDLAVFNLLLDLGADPTPALSSALWAGGYDLAESAMEHGAVPDQATASNMPLLNDLIRWGQFQHALWLLERNASPNLPDARGWTAMHQAASRGNERVLRALLEAGGDPQRRDLQGNSPRDVTRSEKIAALLSSAAGPRRAR